jgi:hypothetical protein
MPRLAAEVQAPVGFSKNKQNRHNEIAFFLTFSEYMFFYKIKTCQIGAQIGKYLFLKTTVYNTWRVLSSGI